MMDALQGGSPAWAVILTVLGLVVGFILMMLGSTLGRFFGVVITMAAAVHGALAAVAIANQDWTTGLPMPAGTTITELDDQLVQLGPQTSAIVVGVLALVTGYVGLRGLIGRRRRR